MTGKGFAILILGAAGALAQQTYVQRAWYKDGTGLEFYTQASGSTTPVSTQGSLVLSDNSVHRIVLDRNNNVLFAYEVEAATVPPFGDIFIRLKPLSSRFESMFREGSNGDRYRAPGRFPTLSSERSFPAVKRGEAVVFDILQNPSTREKIYDVICPTSFPNPFPESSLVTGGAATNQELTFRDMQIVVHGGGAFDPVVRNVNGVALYLYLPGRGSYYLSTEPAAGYASLPTGRIVDNVLEFTSDNEQIAVTSKDKILKKPESVTVWVYREPSSGSLAQVQQKLADLQRQLAQARTTYSDRHPNVLRLQSEIATLEAERNKQQGGSEVVVKAAGRIEDLLPKK